MAETVITDYVLARNVTITVNGIKQRATTASYRQSAGEVDVANLRSGLFYEGTTDIIKTEFQLTIAVSAAEGVPLPEPTQTCPLKWETIGGKTHDGTLLIVSASENASPRGLYAYQLTGTLTGPVVTTG